MMQVLSIVDIPTIYSGQELDSYISAELDREDDDRANFEAIAAIDRILAASRATEGEEEHAACLQQHLWNIQGRQQYLEAGIPFTQSSHHTQERTAIPNARDPPAQSRVLHNDVSMQQRAASSGDFAPDYHHQHQLANSSSDSLTSTMNLRGLESDGKQSASRSLSQEFRTGAAQRPEGSPTQQVESAWLLKEQPGFCVAHSIGMCT